MISTDFRKLELVSQFSSFLQLLADKDALLKVIQDAKDVLEQNKALLAPLRTKEEADAYLQEAKDKLEKTHEVIKREFAEADSHVATIKATAALALKEAIQEKDTWADLKQKQATVLQEIDKLREELTLDRNELDKNLEAQRLAKEEIDLANVKLQEKLAQLQKVMGD